MPYIQTRINKDLTKEQELKLKERIENSLSIIGKDKSWVMTEFVPNCHLYFNEPDTIAYVDVKVYGRNDASSYNNLTKEITSILQSELDINPNNIYISYSEYLNWGWNGHNF